jgi:diguanylate cyclase (GGDEF)-like protein
MLRDGARLIDLTALTQPPTQPKSKTHSPKVDHSNRDTNLLYQAHPSRFANFDRVLVAMEQAQNLRIGDPLSGERDVILDNILSLLSLFLPSLQLFILLFGERPEQWTSDRIHFTSSDRPLPHWLVSRAKGTEIWITSWLELPDDIKLALTKLTQETDEEPTQVSARFDRCLAVPLTEPQWDPHGETDVSQEAGLLFALPRNGWARDELLKVVRRLSSFVTRRWRHLRDVNQRIHNDSLTGVHNRAFFDSQFGIELERAKRDGSAMALVLGDLDHFKEVNDRYGHQAGDEVLKLVARELQRAMRRIDHVCRIGGEEFALILPNTPASAAQEVMARLLSRLAKLSVRLPEMEAPINVTLSFGAVTFPDGGSDAFELYRKADSMLYLSKGTGRNRCHFWIQSDEPLVILPEPQDV